MLVNLAYLLRRPTGTTNYALNLLPALMPLQPCFLATAASGLAHYYPVPATMTAEYGQWGHLRRLLWTQFRVPSLYRQLVAQGAAADLLFSPITEAPLASRCRFVVTLHDLIPLRFPAGSRSLRWLYRYYVPRVLATAEHVICNSQATADDAITFYGLPAHKLTPIPLAHDATQFRPLGLPRQNYFLILGRHAPYKNVATAIQAFAHLPPSLDVALRIAGPTDPRYTPALHQQVVALGLSQRVKFLDYVADEQLPVLLNQAIALVFPSLWEGFGLPVLEAMACGTPVIASDRAAIPEVTGEAALLVDPTRPAAIAQAMQTLVQDPHLHQHLTVAAQARAAQFSWQRTGDITRQLLQHYCSGRS